jgi:hypothetical protein
MLDSTGSKCVQGVASEHQYTKRPFKCQRLEWNKLGHGDPKYRAVMVQSWRCMAFGLAPELDQSSGR